ncbi:WD40-repeat-containing domain protein [Schizophyllum fasciatum]
MGGANKPISISSDEINTLIYAYLRDSGLQHTAYCLRTESQLDSSPCFSTYIPRGELIELLSKALLYIEVEHHWRRTPETKSCKNGFSLLQRHTCAPSGTKGQKSVAGDPKKGTPMEVDALEGPASAAVADVARHYDAGVNKRKAETPSEESQVKEKRQRKEVTEEAPLSVSEQKSTSTSTASSPMTNLAREMKQKNLRGAVDDVTNGRATDWLSGHVAEVFVCAFNPKNIDTLASGAKDGTVLIWQVYRSAPELFPGHSRRPIKVDAFAKSEQGDLTSLSWSPDGELLAVGSYDQVFRIITAEGKMYFSHAQHTVSERYCGLSAADSTSQGPIFVVRFSPDGKYVLSASLDSTVGLWDVANKRLVRQYHTHTDSCLDVVWISSDTFASCGADAAVHILRIDGPSVIKELLGHRTEINQIKVNSTSTRLASCSDDRTARIWDITKVRGVSPSNERIPGLEGAGAKSLVLSGHEKSVSTIAWQPKLLEGLPEILATSSFDGTARMWNSETGECLVTFSDHKRPVYALSFSPDGRCLATGSGDGFMHIYSVQKRQRVWSWYAGNVKQGVFEIEWQMGDGGPNRIALALENRTVAVIDLDKVPAFRPA